MFSQYSWWDFTKFVLALAIPYYAFVLWKYYREDIRDWLSNKGQKEPNTIAPVADDDDDDTDELYSVKTYSNDVTEPAVNPDLAQTTETLEEEEVEHKDEPIMARQVAVEAEISEGVIVPDQPNETFELALPATPIRPTERSLSDVINAARRMKVDDNGNHTPYNPEDAEAVELANTLNQQKGLGNVLTGVPFNR